MALQVSQAVCHMERFIAPPSGGQGETFLLLLCREPTQNVYHHTLVPRRGILTRRQSVRFATLFVQCTIPSSIPYPGATGRTIGSSSVVVRLGRRRRITGRTIGGILSSLKPPALILLLYANAVPQLERMTSLACISRTSLFYPLSS